MLALFIRTSPVDCTTKSERLYLAHITLKIPSGVVHDIKKKITFIFETTSVRYIDLVFGGKHCAGFFMKFSIGAFYRCCITNTSFVKVDVATRTSVRGVN